MDSIFIFGLALILFGPKKLPEIGRQIGKIVLEFRKASNEFKMQIEDELRASEQAERQKKIAEETAALSAGVIPVAALETSTPSALSLSDPALSVSDSALHFPDPAPQLAAPSALEVHPPSVGEQVSSDAPYRGGLESLAAVIVDSPGEDPNQDAIAEIYPPAESSTPASFAAESVTDRKSATVAAEEMIPASATEPMPHSHHGDSLNGDRPIQETDLIQETDRTQTDPATTHHG